jgi:glycine/D-amino acid oxidase-like deaminating enzyme
VEVKVEVVPICSTFTSFSPCHLFTTPLISPILRKMAHTPPENILIIGGGIAGVSTAYYLSISPNRPSNTKITLVEECKIAAAASGYSGGFLAKDWHGSATSSLAAMSYDLHAKLAEEFDGGKKWGYRTVDTLVSPFQSPFAELIRIQSIETDATRPSKKKTPLPWLPQGLVHSSRSLGTPTTTAQVHPGLFTNFMSRKYLEQPNTSLILGKAASLHFDPVTKSPKSVRVGDNDIPTDSVVIAAGPWTGELAKSLLGEEVGGRLGVTGHRAHSVVLKTKEQLSAHCLFTSMTLEDGSMGEPEVYTRPDGTTYM